MSAVSASQLDDNDSLGKKISILTTVIAILLCLFTIFAHRSHSKSLELQNEITSMWSHYQAKRMREYQTQLNMDLLQIIPSSKSDKSKILKRYTQQKTDYTKELTQIKSHAEQATLTNHLIQKKGFYYNLSEGILEISLILSSVYFISRKRLFPILGFFLCCAGSLTGLFGFFL